MSTNTTGLGARLDRLEELAPIPPVPVERSRA